MSKRKCKCSDDYDLAPLTAKQRQDYLKGTIAGSVVWIVISAVFLAYQAFKYFN